MSAERVVNSKRVYEGRVINLRVDEIALEGGASGLREVVEHRGAVAIIATDADGRIAFVRQYRRAAETELLELPAGTMEAGEPPERTAIRELEEETGLIAERVAPFIRFFLAPGYSSEEMHVFIAEGLREGIAKPEDDEALTAERYTLAEALALIEQGVIRDAKTIAALLAYARRHPALAEEAK